MMQAEEVINDIDLVNMVMDYKGVNKSKAPAKRLQHVNTTYRTMLAPHVARVWPP